ncbi:MAG: hypothetical protein Fur0032_19680 [Terrimicrobiaceae bacterium]
MGGTCPGVSKILDFLADRLAGGRATIGQVVVSGTYRLRHVDDEHGEIRETFTDPEDAQALTLFTDDGQYRPLKTSPDLRHGWELRLASLAEVRLALDLLYPAALANALALSQGRLTGTPLRETLGRQTGMYAVTKKLTNEEAGPLISSCCDDRTRCMNQILWNIEGDLPTPLTHTREQILATPLPLVCTEACCLVVAAARQTVKSRPVNP